MASAACLALNIMSCRPTTEINAVALVSTSQLLVKPGMARRIICGTWMRKNTWRGLMPYATPASAWPLGMPKKAPRKVSER
ncbi:hypothetical protein D9M73_277920 [compost metagenome]